MSEHCINKIAELSLNKHRVVAVDMFYSCMKYIGLLTKRRLTIMQIKRISISNYRAIKHAEIDIGSMCGFIGRNGAGKSSVLNAIALFYQLSSNVSMEDFYNRETSKDIEIAITFYRLRDSEIKLFAPYLKDNELSVRKVLT